MANSIASEVVFGSGTVDYQKAEYVMIRIYNLRFRFTIFGHLSFPIRHPQSDIRYKSIMKQSVILTIHGHVQGVGYRYFVLQKAENYGISGFVKNRMNGNVYIEAEGQAEQLGFFINACQQGPSHAWVEKVDAQYCPVQDFTEFVIK